MIYKIPAAFVLLVSALSPCYYVSGAVVSLLVPFADPDNAVTANYLGTDAEGHTSWSVGIGVTSGSFTNTDFIPGTFDLRIVVADATNVQEVGAINTVLDGVTATITATGECSLATATESGGGVSAACSFSAQLVDAFSGTTSTTVITSAYTSLQTLLAVQVPDTGSGAIPTAAATSSSGTASSSGSTPTSTSTKNGAMKEKIGWGVAGAAGLIVVGLV